MTLLDATEAPSATAVLTCTEVSKTFGDTVALDRVSISVSRGSVHGLLGPNGAGKSTLLRSVFGLIRPDSGQVQVCGRAVHSTGSVAERSVAGFVEAPRFYPYLSGTRNLDLLAALDGPVATLGVHEVCDTVGLGDERRRKVAGYSTGMRQRLGIAAALLRDPELLVLDEPATGLDPRGAQELHELIASVAAARRTVLLSSHDMAEVELLCDSVTVLRTGQVAYSGPLQELRSRAPSPTHRLRTSDDDAARVIADAEGVEVQALEPGLLVRAETVVLDGFVLALAHHGVAVRALLPADSALQAAFLQLTGSGHVGSGHVGSGHVGSGDGTGTDRTDHRRSRGRDGRARSLRPARRRVA